MSDAAASAHLPLEEREANALRAAQNRIADVRLSGSDKLDLSYLRDLAEIPSEVGELANLRKVNFSSTNISDITVLARLPFLEEITLIGVSVTDIYPLHDLRMIKRLNLHGIPAESYEVIRNLVLLEELNLHGTKFNDPAVLSELPNLETLYLGETRVSEYDEIARLHQLQNLFLHDTPGGDLSALVALRELRQLTVGRGTSDLAPIMHASKLRRLVARNTKVRVIPPAYGLESLRIISLRSSPVADIRSLADVRTLESVDLDRTFVTDISPLATIPNIKSLSVRSIRGVDIGPAAYMTGLSRSVAEPSTQGKRSKRLALGGLDFTARKQEDEFLYSLMRRRQPDKTVLAVNYLRMQRGLELFWPDSYDGRRELPVLHYGSTAHEDGVDFEQRPAPYRFIRRENKLEARAQIEAPFDLTIADDMRLELLVKIAAAKGALVQNSADERLLASVDALQDVLQASAQEARVGLLLMRYRSLQADTHSYVAASSDFDRTVRSIVEDLAKSTDDYLALYPAVRTIEANRQALQFQANDADLTSFSRDVRSFSELATNSEVVADSAVSALTDSQSLIDTLTQTINSSANERTRAKALEARAAVAGFQALDVKNLSSAAVSWMQEECGSFTSETWKATRKGVTKGFATGIEKSTEAATKLAIAYFVAHIAGPIAGIAQLIASFNPLARKTSEIKNGLPDEEHE